MKHKKIYVGLFVMFLFLLSIVIFIFRSGLLQRDDYFLYFNLFGGIFVIMAGLIAATINYIYFPQFPQKIRLILFIAITFTFLFSGSFLILIGIHPIGEQPEWLRSLIKFEDYFFISALIIIVGLMWWAKKKYDKSDSDGNQTSEK